MWGLFFVFNTIQDTRKHSNRMRTACFPSFGGDLPTSRMQTPPRQTPLMQTHLNADPPVGRPPPHAGHVTYDACWKAAPL